MKQWELDAAMAALRAKREQQSMFVRGYLTDEVLDDTARTVLEAREDAEAERKAAEPREAAQKPKP